NRDGAGFEDGIRLRLVQPNIPQVDKWVPELRAGHVRKQIALSTAPEAKGKPPTHAIWGETMVPFDLAADGNLQRALAAAVPAPQGLVIVGAPRVER
ncbi:MAG: apolipoprotein N-acyltransferase, partial [Magnetovibrionaceae bacterium]